MFNVWINFNTLKFLCFIFYFFTFSILLYFSFKPVLCSALNIVCLAFSKVAATVNVPQQTHGYELVSLKNIELRFFVVVPESYP